MLKPLAIGAAPSRSAVTAAVSGPVAPFGAALVAAQSSPKAPAPPIGVKADNPVHRADEVTKSTPEPVVERPAPVAARADRYVAGPCGRSESDGSSNDKPSLERRIPVSSVAPPVTGSATAVTEVPVQVVVLSNQIANVPPAAIAPTPLTETPPPPTGAGRALPPAFASPALGAAVQNAPRAVNGSAPQDAAPALTAKEAGVSPDPATNVTTAGGTPLPPSPATRSPRSPSSAPASCTCHPCLNPRTGPKRAPHLTAASTAPRSAALSASRWLTRPTAPASPRH